MNGVQVRSTRATRFELLSTRNLFLTCGTMVLLLGAARYSMSGSPIPVISALHTEGQISYAPRPDDLKEAQVPRELTPLTTGQMRVARYIHAQYQITREAAEEITTVAEDVGKTVGLDPMLLLAVIAIESRFNPIAESSTGAQGLMQIMPRIHAQKVSQLGAGTDDVLQPWINVLIGAQILHEYIGRAGALDAGLQWYNGAPNDESKGYSSRVLAERDRLVHELRARPNGKT
jgi:hypothetical protein